MYRLMRRASLVASAGVLFQAAGCQVNTNEIAATLTISILNNVLASYVFGAFNLIP
jgi:hypothetical protein